LTAPLCPQPIFKSKGREEGKKKCFNVKP